MTITRRRALAAYAAFVTASRVSRAQELAGEAPGRIPPIDELVNASEFRAVAQRKLDSLTFAEIEGSHGAAFERMTFRPRLMNDSRAMDLSTEVLGQTLFTPILVGPVANQKRYHPEGELAMARGASAANAITVVAGRSSVAINQIAEQAKMPLWYQVYLDGDPTETRKRVEQALSVGCKALCVTIGTEEPAPRAGIDWSALEQLRRTIKATVLLKGVMSAEEARKAVSAGVQGLVVSNYAARTIPGVASPIEVLPSVVEAVNGKAAILMDGSIRRGSDVLKALALGAQAVLLARPAIWGLAAYGAAGVQNVVELIQSEFARDMAMCGKVNIKAIDRDVVRIHRR
jgi:isopentenyl diphosphate isomerase/L-lactate dehydrogenase-like FMN-dependent dehydrogenase